MLVVRRIGRAVNELSSVIMAICRISDWPNKQSDNVVSPIRRLSIVYQRYRGRRMLPVCYQLLPTTWWRHPSHRHSSCIYRVGQKKLGHHFWRLTSPAYIFKTPEPISMIFGAFQRLFYVDNVCWLYIQQIHHTKWRHLAKVKNMDFAFNRCLKGWIQHRITCLAKLENKNDATGMLRPLSHWKLISKLISKFMLICSFRKKNFKCEQSTFERNKFRKRILQFRTCSILRNFA